MPFTDEEEAMIKNLYQFKEYRSRNILTKCPKKNCKKDWTLHQKIQETGNTN